MKREDVSLLVCPETRQPLTLATAEEAGGEITAGLLSAPGGRSYRITAGLPDLTFPPDLAAQDEHARVFYDGRAEAYDQNLHLTFKTHGEDEQQVRNRFIDALELQPTARVLEVSCGTGRDSEIIASRLGPRSSLLARHLVCDAGPLPAAARRSDRADDL